MSQAAGLGLGWLAGQGANGNKGGPVAPNRKIANISISDISQASGLGLGWLAGQGADGNNGGPVAPI